jgi:hypothetical protein
MSDALADRLKKLAEQKRTDDTQEQQVRNFQERVNEFIANKARPEYERFLTLIQQRIAEVNPSLGDLPPFQYSPLLIQQGNAAAFTHFDKPILNQPNNALLLSFGPHPHAMYLLSEPPPSRRYRLQAAASDSLDRIVWTGDLGELETEQLADFILEHLTQYYLDHKPS